MPEGPELASSRDKLHKILVGKRFRGITIEGGRYAKTPPVGLEDFNVENSENFTIESIDTKGKFMWWTVGPWKMWCTYGMSGQWTTKKSDHTALTVWFDNPDGSELSCVHFRDPRRFGTVKFVKDDVAHAKKLRSLGPDVLTSQLTSDIFAQNILKKPNRAICEALMDQTAVAGIGNYLRAEALFDCSIDPWASVTDLTSNDYVRLCESVKRISLLSYEAQGASIKTYRGIDGSSGGMQFTFKVYGKKADPEGNPVSRRRDANGRMMHWCPAKQK